MAETDTDPLKNPTLKNTPTPDLDWHSHKWRRFTTRPPLGWQLANPRCSQIEADQDERNALSVAAWMWVSGEYSIRGIARYLTAEYPRTRDTASSWSHATISRFLEAQGLHKRYDAKEARRREIALMYADRD